MSISKELLRIANQLSKYEDYHSPELYAIEKAANTVGRSWSGSWLGYHSRVYYADFQLLPAGTAFSKSWGSNTSKNTRGNWKEYTSEEVVDFIHEQAGNSSLRQCTFASKEAAEAFEKARQSTLSLVHANYDLESNKFLANLATKIESLEISTEDNFIKTRTPSNKIVSRDIRALEEGLVAPPHIQVLSITHATKAPFQSCKDVKKQIVSLVNHIQNLENRTNQEDKIGNKIFIGHGRSLHWLKTQRFYK